MWAVLVPSTSWPFELQFFWMLAGVREIPTVSWGSHADGFAVDPVSQVIIWTSCSVWFICSSVPCSFPILFLKCFTLAMFWQKAGSLIVAQYISASRWTWVGTDLSWRWNTAIVRVVRTSGQLWLSGKCSDFFCAGSCVASSLVCPFSFSMACCHVHVAQLCLLRGFVLVRDYWQCVFST